MKKYIIWTPKFMAHIGGVTVLHKFCDMLNRLGENAYLWPADNNFHTFLTNGKYITPLASYDMIDDEAIIIYPEIVIGNPLNAKNVVRWILNIPGKMGGDGVFGENDLLFYFSKHFSEGKEDLFYLMIVESYGDLFQNYNLKERIGSCYTLRKGVGRELIHDTSDSFEITDSTPSEGLVEIFNKRKYFYSYDDSTFLSFQAALCGCISIIVPTERYTAEEYYNSSPFHKNGIAYGEDDIKHAINTMKNVGPFLEEFEFESYKQLVQFVFRTDQHFLGNNHSKNDSRFSDENILKKAITDNAILFLMIKKTERLINQDQIDEAHELLKILFNAHPRNLDVLNNIAVIYIIRENFTEAITVLKTVLTSDPKNEIALGNFQYLSENIETDDFQQQNSVNNMNIDISNEKILEAEQFIENEQLDKASEILKDLLEVDSQNIDALNDLAVILIIKLKFLEAIKLLNQVLEINPENEVAIENLTYISEQENFEVNSDFEMIDCPFCGSNKVEEFRKSADIVKCKECDTIYLRTRFNKDKMYEVYQSYADGDSHMSLPTSESEIKSSGLRREYFMKEILEFVKPEGNFLDIGCGWGAFLDNARDKGFTPRGIEMTRKCVSFANENLKIKVTNEQFEDTPFDENSLSVVSMNHVFEHLPFPLEAINKLYKVLKPGGMFCGIVPNINSFVSQKKTEEWYWLDPIYHYVHYSPQTLQKHLENAGFIIERIYTATGDYGSENVKKELEKITEFKNGELEKMLQNLEKNGEGEEIRFFIRKPK